MILSPPPADAQDGVPTTDLTLIALEALPRVVTAWREWSRDPWDDRLDRDLAYYLTLARRHGASDALIEWATGLRQFQIDAVLRRWPGVAE